MSGKKVILLIDTARAYARQIMSGVLRYSDQNGPWAFHRKNLLISYDIESLKKWGGDGVISVEQNDQTVIEALGLPTIIAGYYKLNLPKYANIFGDVQPTDSIGAEHLEKCGLKNFAFYGYGDGVENYRGHTFIKYLSGKGYYTSYFKLEEFFSTVSIQDFYEEKLKWLSSLPKPIGIMARNDESALELVEMCKICNYRVPEDVSILGIDNDEYICELIYPKISSVVLNAEEAGYEAAKILDGFMHSDALGKPEQRDILVKPKYVQKRLSTDFIPTSDVEVIKAVRYIRSHANKNISVNNVVAEVCLSRRVLERRFKSILGKTVLDEIRRVRVNDIKYALTQTNKQIRRIAMELDFSSVDHISRYFKHETGVSLREYRRKHFLSS